jgi:hypothetical protein
VIWKDTNVSEDHAASMSNLRMEAAWSSETMIPYNTAQSHNPEQPELNLQPHENLTLHTKQIVLRVVILPNMKISRLKIPPTLRELQVNVLTQQ